jgi:hypothetical protein
MVEFLRDLESLLPESLHPVLKWHFIPWGKVRERHADLTGPPLVALFEAYHSIDDLLNLESLAWKIVPEESWGCMRCGFCCSYMRPGPVPARLFLEWEKAGVPVAWFYKPRKKGKPNSTYRCWYNNGTRLRICPFMIVNLTDGKPFCSIYHMGDDHRPPVCSKYVPRHETCTAEKLDIEPWESN